MTDGKKVSFGEKLKQARERASMTQSQLAEVIGTTKQHIYQWESGKVRPSVKYEEMLEQALPDMAEEPIFVYGATDSRFAQAMQALGLDEPVVAYKTGLSEDEIRGLMGGGTRATAEHYLAFRGIGVNDEWLATGRGQMLLGQPDGDSRTMADRIKVALGRLGVTQAELAAGTGLTSSQVSLWASGEHEPSVKNRKAIADFLGISDLWLRTGEGPMQAAAQPEPSLNDRAIEEAKLLIEMIGDMRAKGEDIPETVKLRLMTHVNNILGQESAESS